MTDNVLRFCGVARVSGRGIRVNPGMAPFGGRLDRSARRAGRVCPVVMSAAERRSRMERVRDYVEIHIGQAMSVDDLAREAGLSRYHFSRVFREEIGMSPWAYVREARLRRARQLLQGGSSIAEAALEAGFADQSHLTRTLRSVEGRTPGEILRDATGGRDEPEKSTIVQDTHES